jgi:hypothetical protein
MGNTIAAVDLEVPSDISSLPDLNGHGNMFSLQQAMVRDASGELKSLVENFAAESSQAARETLMFQILLKWAGVRRAFTNYTISNFAGGTLNILESYFGQPVLLNPEVFVWPDIDRENQDQVAPAYSRRQIMGILSPLDTSGAVSREVIHRLA